MKILVITEYIAPTAAIASIRWTKLSKYLSRNHDATIDILTNKKEYRDEVSDVYYQYDKTLAKDERYFGQVYEISGNFRVKTANCFFKLIGEIVKRRASHEIESSETITNETNTAESPNRDSLLKKVFYKFYSWLFRVRGKGYYAAALKMPINWDDYDAIISSFGPKWVHLIGAKAKSDNPEIVWIADFRDPALASADVPKEEKPVFADMYAGTANALTAVTKETFDALGAQHPCQRVITNGFDPDELNARERWFNDKFYIAYTGTLYNNKNNNQISDLKPLMLGVSELIKDGDIDIEDIEFVYAGWNSDYFESQIEHFGNLRYTNLGSISREDALELQNKSSILALCTWNTPKQQGVATGKSYEYLSSKVPIVAICSGTIPNSLAKEMVESANVGVCYEEANAVEDYKRLKTFVLEKYQQWKNDGMSSCNPNWDYINSFGYDALAQKFYDLIRELDVEK